MYIAICHSVYIWSGPEQLSDMLLQIPLGAVHVYADKPLVSCMRTARTQHAPTIYLRV